MIPDNLTVDDFSVVVYACVSVDLGVQLCIFGPKIGIVLNT